MGCLHSQDKSLRSENKSLKLQVRLIQYQFKALSNHYDLSRIEIKRLQDYNRSLVKIYNELASDSNQGELIKMPRSVSNREASVDQTKKMSSYQSGIGSLEKNITSA